MSQVGRFHTVQEDLGRMVRREAGDPARMAFIFRISAYEGRFVPGKATVEAGAETFLRKDGRWLHDWDYLKDGVHLSVSH